MSDLTVRNLNLSTILENFSLPFNFIVPAGQCMGVSGPSGIGKSVLLKALADMLPHKGQIYLGDVESRSISAPQWRRQVALLPAESQWWCETVGEHLEYYDEHLFSRLGFAEEVLDWQISHLSSGEKQRLACIRLLMNEPEALLLDEPTANLDEANRSELELIVAEYQQEKQIPVVWISHDAEQLVRVSQLSMVFDKGNYTVKDGVANSFREPAGKIEQQQGESP